MKVCLLIQATAVCRPQYRWFLDVVGHYKCGCHWGIILYCFMFFVPYFLVWRFCGQLSEEEVKWGGLRALKRVCLGKLRDYMKGNILKNIKGFFSWFVIFRLMVISLISWELVPFVEGFGLVLYVLLVFRLRFYVSYFLSSTTRSYSSILTTLTWPASSWGRGFFTVWLEMLSQIIRPFVIALRLTLHGLTGIVVIYFGWQIAMSSVNAICFWEKQFCLDQACNLVFFGWPTRWRGYVPFIHPIFYSSVFSCLLLFFRKCFLLLVGTFLKGLVMGAWFVFATIEYRFYFLQLGIFLFLALFYRSEHAELIW